jgi:hypothetical protein
MTDLPLTEPPDITPDDLGIEAVAARLGKSVGWLNWRLSLDRGEAEPKLQHHHYIGRTPRWDEDEYQRLRQALTTRTPPKGGRQRKPRPEAAPAAASSSSNAPATGMSTELLAFEDARAACDAVLAYRPGQSSGKPPTKSSAKSKMTSSTKSSTGSSHRRRLGLRLVNTSD